MPEPVISVRGEASLEVEPEIAVVWVSVQARQHGAVVGEHVERDPGPGGGRA